MIAPHHDRRNLNQTRDDYPSNGAPGLLIALGLALIFASWLLPSGFIEGSHPYWHAQNEDITVYQAGFNAFFSEPWRWPLWRITSLNWPEGTSATFVDILPLYAAALKWLAPAVWFPFNPFGYWVLLCILLQAVGAWWVLREARVGNWWALVGLVLLLVSYPAWLVRMGHISLMSHWVISFAFALYLRSAQLTRLTNIWPWLLLTAVMFNIYLFAMAALVYAADSLRWLFRGQAIRTMAQALLIATALVVIGWATLWPLPAATGSPDAGFGRYAMNLLAPISGCGWFAVSSTNPQMLSSALNGLGLGGCWINPTNLPAEQVFEGFNYLGLGVGVLILGALLSGGLSKGKPDAEPKTAKSGWVLACLLALVTLYALSNQVYLGDRLILQWQVPAWASGITGQFRASGRFFWVVGYALVIFSVIRLFKRAPKAWAQGVIAIALMAQAVDIWPYLQQVRHLQPKPDSQIINAKVWQASFPHSKQTVYFFPKLKCAKHSDFFKTLLPVMQFAAEHKLNINTAYTARYTPACNTEAQDIAASDPARSVYVFVRADYPDDSIQALFPDDWRMTCKDQDFALICQHAPNVGLLH